MEKNGAPDWVHVFVCVNDRHGERPSCADGDAVEVRRRLKAAAKERGWWNTRVRVSQTGCLGLCRHGPNVLLHPEGVHFLHVSVNDVGQIIDEIEQAISDRSKNH